MKAKQRSDGSQVVNDNNFFQILVTQMTYLVNTLHHLSYIIQTIVLSSHKDIILQNTETTYINVSNALNLMHYFYDLISFLEWELQYLRNDKQGEFFKKKIPEADKQHNNYIYRYDTKLDAEPYYLKTSKLKQVTEKNSKLRNEFQLLYDELDEKFQDAKKQFNNFLSFIKKYNLHYEIAKVRNVYVLIDKKRLFYPNDSVKSLYEHPIIYIRQFIKEFKTHSSDYKKDDFSTIRIKSKDTHEAIIGMTNSMIYQSSSNDIITYTSLDLNSVEFINYLIQAKNNFTITSLVLLEVSGMIFFYIFHAFSCIFMLLHFWM